MSDYLWDKSGEPDPAIEKLEELLRPLGETGPKSFIFPRRRSWVPMAIAASLLVIVAGTWALLRRDRVAWQVSSLAGRTQAQKLARGGSIHTDGTSRAKLALESVGEIEVEPNSDLRVLALGPSEQRLDLRRGKIRAMIWAPPGQFFVNTPSAVTVDLGCAYNLEVDETGAGLVKVTAGWVAFESDGHESFIPATAVCVTRPGKGPGIPYYEDASQALQRAVSAFDANREPAATAEILREARERDAITLWHLLRRVSIDQRGLVFDRLSQLIALPSNVTRQGILEGNAAMIDAIWDALDLGDTSWWRMWKSRTPDSTPKPR